jgi:DeoR/GlpR family transcriptional regulator of sugar metabolism
MLPHERRKLILEKLIENEKISIEQLGEQLHVSTMTIRRDLAFLEEEEKIIRTHGGAILKKRLIAETSFQSKKAQNSDEKKKIAYTALNYIQDQSTILLDSGTTTLEIAKLLKNESNLTVITNDIKIASELLDSKLKVIVLGGELQNTTGTLFGTLTQQVLENLNVDIFFLGAHAIDFKAGVTAPTHEKAFIKKLMIKAAESTWLVADSSKLHQKSFTKVCDLSDIEGVITDDRITDEDRHDLQEYLHVTIADGRENV